MIMHSNEEQNFSQIASDPRGALLLVNDRVGQALFGLVNLCLGFNCGLVYMIYTHTSKSLFY